MNSKQRVLSAIARRPTDRVPITFDAEKEVYDLLHQRLGTSSTEELLLILSRVSCSVASSPT